MIYYITVTGKLVTADRQLYKSQPHASAKCACESPKNRKEIIMFDYKGFAHDFRIAEMFGKEAIRDTFERATKEWKDNADYFGSLVMTLNHLLWYHYDNGNSELAELYDELWRKADELVFELFKGEELQKIVAFLD